MEGRRGQFAYFTFLVVDSRCVQSPNKDEWEIIVCSDGADYGESVETGPKLKVFRMRISEALENLAALEMLSSTPKEVGRRCAMVSSVQPPAALAGPPPVMMEYKWRAIAGLPEPEGEDLVEVVEA